MRPSLLAAALLLAAAAPGSAQAPAESEFRLDRPGKLSEQDMMSKSADDLGGMRKMLSEVLKKLEEARDSKDVVKLNCVNEKLTQIKGLLRISEQADISLQEAVAKRETSSAEHEYTKVAIAHDKVRQLRAEAEECIGLSVFDVGEQKIEVIVPKDLPVLDPTLTPKIPPVVARPPAASPVRF